MPRLNSFQRTKIVILRELKFSYGNIAKEVGCSKSSAERVYKKFQKENTIDDLPRSGRPTICSARDERLIYRTSMNNRRLTAPKIKTILSSFHNMQLSESTVKRVLRKFGLFGRIARKKPYLTATHKKQRLSFAKEYQHWTPSDWATITFSDESKFNLFHSDGRIYVRRKIGEEFREDCIQPTQQSGGGSVHVWGCFCQSEIGPLVRLTSTVNSTSYQNVLEDHLIPYIAGRALIFQQDNAPAHTARSTTRFLEERSVVVMKWPPKSPDLNPIENLWDTVEAKVRQDTATSRNELWGKILVAWNSIDNNIIETLIYSMPRRIEAVIKAKGGHTKY